MSSTEHDYTEPWAVFQDEDEPWKNRSRLFKLLDQMETQAEVGDALGCTPTTISYWKNKYEEEIREEITDEDMRCPHFETCGNEMPSPRNGICNLCLDLVRRADRDNVCIDTDEVGDRIAELYSEYRDYVAEFRERRRQAAKEDDIPVCDDCEEPMTEVAELNGYLCSSCGAAA